VEILNGNVIIDYREFIAKRGQPCNAKTSISEISLIFKLDPKKLYDKLRDMQNKLTFHQD